MPIVTISRGSYSRGKEVAEKLAAKMQYECVSRDIILEACSEFNIPEIKLVRALHDAPSVLERFQHGKERYLSYYRYALLKHLQRDNVIYHGLAGHFILSDIPHILKVRITANMDDRVQEEMKRENISAEKALFILKKDDDERRRWGLQVHGTDTWDSRLYDLVLHIGNLTVNDAVEILEQTLQKPAFQTTPESKQIMEDMIKSSQIHSMLVDLSPGIKVVVRQGVAFISNVGKELKTDSTLRDTMEKNVRTVEGITSVVIQEPLMSKSAYINPYHNI
ncbi:cytidylate kinase-like family protein [Desulfopila aestuarii]|uniref:Cytidylate kinase n=1 Tax=Desulfopila aestuarii DSM 18488 TaxID=1121416 RepID=A0A1M7YFK0_9BACT|nr:cytidylate kinase-like family protein [Desulfopila aestuarii]SHO51288.1 Cytidylate kinase [Desulfopila aestuarii DSM 18488]